MKTVARVTARDCQIRSFMRTQIVASVLLLQLPAFSVAQAQSASPIPAVAAVDTMTGTAAAHAGPAAPDSVAARVRADSYAKAATDTAIAVVFGGWIDTYYAYDFNRPPGQDHAFTAEVARHNEFNVNLAYVDATLSGARVHGRAAIQFGNAVQANYAAEPRIGSVSGPDVSRFLQEAWAGYKVAPPVWLDAGVFLSSFGPESFISRDNWTYIRSLVGENSPTAEAGLRATWQVNPKWAIQGKVLNWWSIISENNHSKSLGWRVDWTPKEGYDIAYDGFLGNEMPDSVPHQLRTWHEAIVQVKPSAQVQLRGAFDYGQQERANGDGSAAWRGWSAIARWQLLPTVAVAARGEYYSDPEQVIVATGLPDGFRASGASFDVDVAPIPHFRWRTELHYLHGKDPLFPTHEAPGVTKNDPLLVTSLGITW